MQQDHPRLCGEKDSGWVAVSEFKGITPAYAGKSKACGVTVYRIKDHPRLCGEKFINLCDQLGVQGITPAYAGKRMRAAEDE